MISTFLNNYEFMQMILYCIIIYYSDKTFSQLWKIFILLLIIFCFCVDEPQT